MKTAVLLTMVHAAGCWGAPFETGLLEPVDAQTLPEAGVMPSPRLPEAAPEASAEATTVDAGAPEDTETSTSEASICLTSEPFPCGNFKATPPGQFCLLTFNGQTVWSTSPAECSSCETYSCACIGPYAGCSHYACSENAGQVMVRCEQ